MYAYKYVQRDCYVQKNRMKPKTGYPDNRVNYLITDNLALQTDSLVSNELSTTDHTGYVPFKKLLNSQTTIL